MTVPTSERLDLHIHTRCSDGQLDPTEVLEKARGRLGVISICDHDTISAYRDLPPSTEPWVLPGIEISACHQDHDLHLLAYFPLGFGPGLETWVAELEEQRREGIRLGVSRLREAGGPLRWDRLEEEVRGGVPCRSHVARALVSIGFARAPGGLYQRFLGRDRFPRPEARARDVIGRVHREKGIIFWAHPGKKAVAAIGEDLVAAGIDGVERWSRSLDPGRKQRLGEFQETHGITACGGSDLHHESRSLSLGSYWVAADKVDARLLPGKVRARGL